MSKKKITIKLTSDGRLIIIDVEDGRPYIQQLENGLHIENIDTRFFELDQTQNPTFLDDIDLDSPRLPEKNKLYFIKKEKRYGVARVVILKCLVNYKKLDQEVTQELEPENPTTTLFRSRRKRSGKTKKSGAGLRKRLKRSKKSLKKTCNHERNLCFGPG